MAQTDYTDRTSKLPPKEAVREMKRIVSEIESLLEQADRLLIGSPFGVSPQDADWVIHMRLCLNSKIHHLYGIEPNTFSTAEQTVSRMSEHAQRPLRSV